MNIGALVGVDREGHCSFCNETFLERMGYSHEEEVLGKPLHDLIHPRSPSGSGESDEGCPFCDDVRAGRPGGETIQRFQRCDGTAFSARCRTYPIHTSAGTAGSVVSFVDAGSPGKTHAELQLLYKAVEALSVGVTIADPDYRIVYANPAEAALHGYTVEEIIGRDPRHFGPPEMREPLDTARIREMVPFSRRSINLRKDGSKFPVYLTSVKVTDPRGFPTAFVTICEDITEKVVLEEEALRATHLATIGQIAAGVAHEVNNPINSVINLAEILMDEVAGEEQRDMARRIIKEGERISGIVRALLSFARAPEKERAPARVGDMLSEVLTLLSSHLRLDGIVVQQDLPENLPLVSVNTREIEQVFLNLVTNARHALNERYPDPDENKILEIRATVLQSTPHPWLQISFRDRGIGISAKIIDKITLPFFTTKPAEMGTGMGLSIVKNILEKHGGILRVASTKGSSTTITIELPLGDLDED